VGFRARKAFKVMPGVRMTVTPRGISGSVGTGGARVSVHSSGRVTKSASLPGTGLSYVSTSSGSSRQRAAQPAPPPTRTPKPGFLAPKGEKALYAALASTVDQAKLREVIGDFPDYAPIARMILGLALAVDDNDDEAVVLLEQVVAPGRPDPGEHDFMRKYLGAGSTTLKIADGVSATLPLGRDAAALALAEVKQERGDLAGAIDVVEGIDPSVYAAVSLAELYVDAGRYDDTVDLTNGITNTDDPTALLCVFRGVALRDKGFHDAAREAFKEALRSRSRSPEIRHRALVERAATYMAQGRKAQARKDLERVLAEDADYPGLEQLITDACT
jgi:tetratricopeptide (TPR) repeat protein